jgi:hypothetical protein
MSEAAPVQPPCSAEGPYSRTSAKNSFWLAERDGVAADLRGRRRSLRRWHATRSASHHLGTPGTPCDDRFPDRANRDAVVDQRFTAVLCALPSPAVAVMRGCRRGVVRAAISPPSSRRLQRRRRAWCIVSPGVRDSQARCDRDSRHRCGAGKDAAIIFASTIDFSRRSSRRLTDVIVGSSARWSLVLPANPGSVTKKEARQRLAVCAEVRAGPATNVPALISVRMRVATSTTTARWRSRRPANKAPCGRVAVSSTSGSTRRMTQIDQREIGNLRWSATSSRRA